MGLKAFSAVDPGWVIREPAFAKPTTRQALAPPNHVTRPVLALGSVPGQAYPKPIPESVPPA